MEIQKHLADRGNRFTAYLIDILPIVLFVSGVFYFFYGFDETLDAYLNRGADIEPRINFLQQRNQIRNLSTIIWIIYCIVMEASARQATFGKSMMGIKVVDGQGYRMTLLKSISRNLSKILSYLVVSLGFIWILFDKKKQGWHDKIANTFVVKNTLPASKKQEFFSLDDGNQNEQIYASTLSQDWLETTKSNFNWDDYDEYKNRMWEYMTKLFDEVVQVSGAGDNIELWNNLNRPQKAFWAFLCFNGDTDNGGVYQFIFNKPQFIFAVAEMWKEIGMENLSQDYDAVLQELTGKAGKISELKSAWNDESSSFEKRWNSFAEGYKELKSTEKIETYYYDKDFKKDCHKKMADYIERNMDKFRKDTK